MARKSPKHIALERIEYLYKLAKSKLSSDAKASRRYIKMLRDLATKHNVIITAKKRSFCLGCNLLQTSKTSHTRIRNFKRIISCKNCGKIKRLGLTSQKS